MYCTQCGHENPESSRFCAQCGHALSRSTEVPTGETTKVIPRVGGEDSTELPEVGDETPSSGESSVVESLPPGSALLVVKRGPNAGSRFLLDRAVTTAGRHPDSEIFLDDVTVSRRHVEFVREANGFVVRDVGSLNGTYVNREPIDTAILSGGDEVQIGKFRLVFLTSGTAADNSADSAS
ncbi:MAG: FHA domain-containing protein [Geodermatophilaceae bacterium]|nr:FHA domain-containing protein [Geodermatophilaceae bacterium]